MDLYGQDAELRLLSKLVTRLDRQTMMDVGAEQGALASGMLDAGVERLYAFEPHPVNVAALRGRFSGDERVSVYECAVSDHDGSGELRVSSDPRGGSLTFGHTLLSRADTSEVVWADSISVTRRSLQSLIAAGEIPDHVGILKVDTEGHDLTVLHGMGSLEADIIMVEHWSDLPHGLGPCPWTTLDMVEALGPRGFRHFAFIVHRGDFVTLKWDDGDVEAGAMGNLLFVRDSVLARTLPDLLECAGSLAEEAVSVGARCRRVASDRLAIIEGLEQAAGDRLALVHELEEAAEARLKNLDVTTEQLRATNAELDALRLERLNQH
jgi:FkbM family methyltransferase